MKPRRLPKSGNDFEGAGGGGSSSITKRPASSSGLQANHQRARTKPTNETRRQRSRASRKLYSGLKAPPINAQDSNNNNTGNPIKSYRSSEEFINNINNTGSSSRSNTNQTKSNRITNKTKPPEFSTTSGGSSSSSKSSNNLKIDYMCSGCNQAIRDKFLLNACNKFWHNTCLKCDRCQANLGELGSTFYEKANLNLCRQDYFEMFGQKAICAVCDKLIYASEMVMRAKENVYHLECFACQLCGLRFCIGDRFHLCENKIVCQYDYDEHILPIQESMQQLDQREQHEHQGQQHDSNSLNTTSVPIHDTHDSGHHQDSLASSSMLLHLSPQIGTEVNSHAEFTSHLSHNSAYSLSNNIQTQPDLDTCNGDTSQRLIATGVQTNELECNQSHTDIDCHKSTIAPMTAAAAATTTTAGGASPHRSIIQMECTGDTDHLNDNSPKSDNQAAQEKCTNTTPPSSSTSNGCSGCDVAPEKFEVSAGSHSNGADLIKADQ